jgi:hypothetical protein
MSVGNLSGSRAIWNVAPKRFQAITQAVLCLNANLQLRQLRSDPGKDVPHLMHDDVKLPALHGSAQAL